MNDESTSPISDKLLELNASHCAQWLSSRLRISGYSLSAFESACTTRLMNEWRRNEWKSKGSWPEDVPPVCLTCWPCPGFLLSDILIEAGLEELTKANHWAGKQDTFSIEFRGSSYHFYVEPAETGEMPRC